MRRVLAATTTQAWISPDATFRNTSRKVSVSCAPEMASLPVPHSPVGRVSSWHPSQPVTNHAASEGRLTVQDRERDTADATHLGLGDALLDLLLQLVALEEGDRL